MRHRFALILIVVVSRVAFAADPIVGDRVFIKAGAKAKIGNQFINTEQICVAETVEEVDGNLLWLVRGWVRKSDVMFVDEALSLFDQQLRDDPQNSKALRHRGAVWVEKKEFDKAVADYTAAIRLEPANSLIYAGRGTVWHAKGEYDKAIDDYDLAIGIDDPRSDSFVGRGVNWEEKKQFEQALFDFNEAIRLDPKNPYAYSGRGRIWSQKGEIDIAIADFGDAIRLDPKDAYTYCYRAYAFYRKGEDKRAISDFEVAIRLRPNLSDGYSGLAWILATSPNSWLRDGKKAVALATKACEMTEWNNSDCIWILAAAYAENGDWENAIQRQTQFIEMSTTETEKKRAVVRLKLYQQKKPYRDILEPSSGKPDSLLEFLIQNLEKVVAIGILMMFVIGICVIFSERLRAFDHDEQNVPRDFTTVAKFQSLPEAEACKIRLEAEGFVVLLTDAETIRTDWLLSNAIGSVKVQVPTADAEAIIKLLEQIGQRQVEESKQAGQDFCLACGAALPETASQCQSCGWSYAKANEDHTVE